MKDSGCERKNPSSLDNIPPYRISLVIYGLLFDSPMASQDSAVMTMNFEMNGVENEVIDLSQCASILNRRFYRQGLNWAVAGFRIGYNGTLADSVPGFSVGIYQAPQSWVVSGAWKKSMEMWRKQQNEALAESGSLDQKSRYADFKVYLDTMHAQRGFADNLIPVTPGGFTPVGVNQPFPAGEWEYSQIVIPVSGGGGGASEHYLKLLGEDGVPVNHMSCIDGYQKGRAVPFSPDPAIPNPADDSWMNEMFDDGNTFSAVVDNAVDKNNDLPYDQDNYPYGDFGSIEFTAQLHRQVNFTNTTIGNSKI